MAKNNYWGNTQQKLVEQWVMTGNTEYDYLRIYQALIPALNQMVSNIMQRYFSVPLARQYEVKHDVIQHIFLNLHQYKPEKQKAYTFVGTVTRNKIKDLVFIEVNQSKKPKIDLLDEDFDYMLEEGESIFYGSSFEYDEEEIQNAVRILNKMISNYENEIKEAISSRKAYNREQKLVSILEKIKEYLFKYNKGDSHGLFEYVQVETGLNNSEILSYF
jgi:hypothetical protein